MISTVSYNNISGPFSETVSNGLRRSQTISVFSIFWELFSLKWSRRFLTLIILIIGNGLDDFNIFFLFS